MWNGPCVGVATSEGGMCCTRKVQPVTTYAARYPSGTRLKCGVSYSIGIPGCQSLSCYAPPLPPPVWPGGLPRLAGALATWGNGRKIFTMPYECLLALEAMGGRCYLNSRATAPSHSRGRSVLVRAPRRSNIFVAATSWGRRVKAASNCVRAVRKSRHKYAANAAS